jgi:hypothetical protein
MTTGLCRALLTMTKTSEVFLAFSLLYWVNAAFNQKSSGVSPNLG